VHAFPLFPLDLVALPHELIPLHIFEERFKTMMNECLRAECEVGIVWLSDDSLREIGAPRCPRGAERSLITTRCAACRERGALALSPRAS
jgi:Lon protease-like protein